MLVMNEKNHIESLKMFVSFKLIFVLFSLCLVLTPEQIVGLSAGVIAAIVIAIVVVLAVTAGQSTFQFSIA
jgi:hypothetical protein